MQHMSMKSYEPNVIRHSKANYQNEMMRATRAEMHTDSRAQST